MCASGFEECQRPLLLGEVQLDLMALSGERNKRRAFAVATEFNQAAWIRKTYASARAQMSDEAVEVYSILCDFMMRAFLEREMNIKEILVAIV